MIDFGQIDKVIHEKARLSIMTMLASRNQMAFQDLKQELSMSDGNLITHLRTLAKAGYVVESRDETGSRPRTLYDLTESGRTAFQNYVDVLEAIVRSTKPD